MIKKNKEGKVVEFVDEDVFSGMEDGEARRRQFIESTKLPATEAEVEAQFEAAIVAAKKELDEAQKKELSSLQMAVSQLDEVVKKSREAVKAVCFQAFNEAERVMKKAKADAETNRDQALAKIRTNHHAAMKPLNDQWETTVAAYAKRIADACQICKETRDAQLAVLKEAQKASAARAETAEAVQAATPAASP